MRIPDDDSRPPEFERAVLAAAMSQVPAGSPIPGWLVQRLALGLRSGGDAMGELRLLEAYRASHGASIEATRFLDREHQLRELLDG